MSWTWLLILVLATSPIWVPATLMALAGVILLGAAALDVVMWLVPRRRS